MLLQEHRQFEDRTKGSGEWVCELKGRDAEMMGPMIVNFKGMVPEEMAKKNNTAMISGKTTVFMQGARILGDYIEVPAGVEPVFGYTTDTGNHNRKLQESRTLGNKTMLAIRVVTPDSATTRNAPTTSDQIFGTSGDPLNLASQYKACSHNKLRFAPTTVRGTIGGVFTAYLDQNAIGTSDRTIRNAVTTQLNSIFGDLRSQFDHVLLCLPPGTAGNWIGT